MEHKFYNYDIIIFVEQQIVDQVTSSYQDRLNAYMVNLDSLCKSLRYSQLSNVQFVKEANGILREIVVVSSNVGIPSVPSLFAVAENNHAELLLNKAKSNVYEIALETLDDLRRITLQSALDAGETDQLRHALSISFQRLLEALSTLCQQSNLELGDGKRDHIG
jgi:hypothetical protein